MIFACAVGVWFAYDTHAERAAEKQVVMEIKEVTAALKVLFLPAVGVTVGDQIEVAGKTAESLSEMRKRWYVAADGQRAKELRGFRVWYAEKAEVMARSYRNALEGSVAVEVAAAATMARAQISAASGGLVAMPGTQDVERVAERRDSARQSFADATGALIKRRAGGLPSVLPLDSIISDDELIRAAGRINVTINIVR